MYSVSDAYKAAMKQPVQRFRMTGKVGRVSFTDDNILSGSFSITNQCSDDSSVQIGQVYIGELDVTLMNLQIPRYSWKDQEIAPVFGMRLADGSFEDVPLGVFTIDSAKHTASGVVIKAYDHMAKFDKPVRLAASLLELPVKRSQQWQTARMSFPFIVNPISKPGGILFRGWLPRLPLMSTPDGMERSMSVPMISLWWMKSTQSTASWGVSSPISQPDTPVSPL